MNKSTKLKIGLVFDDSLDRSDGVQQYIKTLGSWLVENGNSVHYLVGQSKNGINIHSLSRNIGIKFNGNKLSIPYHSNSTTIKSLLLKEKFDILHIQMPYSPVMAGKVINLAPINTKIVGTFHILPYGKNQYIANKTLAMLQKRQFKRIDAICSVSNAAQKFVKSHYGLESSVIPNMVSLKNWENDVFNHPKRIVFLGRLVPRKGCMYLLKAIKELNKTENFEVIIAGDGPEMSKLTKYCAKQELNNVKFLGYIEERLKRDLLASAEIAVFPSTGGESFGIVLIEAMASGAGIVLGGNNAGYISVLSSMPKVIFSPRKTIEFAKLLKYYIDRDKQREKLHVQQKKLVKNFDTNIVGKQILELYAEAILRQKPKVR